MRHVEVADRASSQFSWVSTASARTSRRQLSALGKMRTTRVPPAMPRPWRPHGQEEGRRSRAAPGRRRCCRSDARASTPSRRCRSPATAASPPAPVPGQSAGACPCSPASAGAERAPGRDGRRAPGRDGGRWSAAWPCGARSVRRRHRRTARRRSPWAVVVPAPEPPHGECDPDAPAIGRQAGKGPHVAAVDSPRGLAAVRAARPGLARPGNRRHPAVIYLHVLDDQPRWQQRRRQSAPTHPSLPSTRRWRLPSRPIGCTKRESEPRFRAG
jgi:hypothetical protein